MAISISSSVPLSIARTSLCSSFSSSNYVFFNTNQAPKFLCPLQSSSRISSSRGRRGLSCNCLFGLGVPELVVIAGVAALVFGPKKLPEVGRSIGKTVKSFQQTELKFFSPKIANRRKAAKEFESELKKDPEPVGDSPADVKSVSNEEEQDAKISRIKES